MGILRLEIENLEDISEIILNNLSYKRVLDSEPIDKSFNALKVQNSTNYGFSFSENSLKRLNGVHPRLITVLKQAIKTSPYDFLIVSGLRTLEEQKKLYAQGRTKPGNIVTNCDGVRFKSNHQAKSDGYGYAIDFGIYDKTKPGNIDWDSNEKYIAVANHIIKLGKENGLILESGAFWKSFKDYPHIELKGVI